MRQIERTWTAAPAIAAALLVACFVSPAFAHKSERRLPFFIGADWSDKTSPAEIKLFFESGCNFVRLTGGGFPEPTIAHAHDLAELKGHGIYAMLQLGSHWPLGDSYTRHTNSYFVDQNGKSGTINKVTNSMTYSGQTWPQYSYASQGFRDRLQRDFTNYLHALGSDPRVVELICHNEPGYFWLANRLFDYNPQAIARFRLWLPTQYRNISALNASWGTNYTSFAQVEPHHSLPPVKDIAAWMDWRRFNVALIANFLTWEEKLAHRLCPNLPSTTNLSGPLDNFYAIRNGDNYAYTAPFDTAGIDIYSGFSDRFWLGYAMDMTRGAAVDKPIVVPECDPYAPSSYPGLTGRQRANRLRSDLWEFAGHGAKAASIWTWSGYKYYSITNGEFNDRFAALREFAHLSKMLHLGRFSSPHRRIALVCDQDAFLYYGGIWKGTAGGTSCQESLEGLYEALVGSGYNVDIICANQVRAGVLPRYHALVLATPVIEDAKLVKSLASYLRRGGVVIAEAPFAQFNRWGKPIAASSNGLQKLFGVVETAPYADNGAQAIPALDIRGEGSVPLRLAGAKEVATFSDGLPAVTRIARGAGRAILIASNVGAMNPDDSQKPLKKFLLSTIERYAAVRPRAVGRTDGYVDTSLLTDSKGNRLIIVTDPSDKQLAPTMHDRVNVVLRGAAPVTGSELFLIDPSHVVDGRTFAGPRRAALPHTVDDVTHMTLSSVDSASVLLIARDHTPLLSLDGPTSGSVGDTVRIDVTCYNPSPRSVVGSIGLDISGQSRAIGTPQQVKIPARGEKTVHIPIRLGQSTGRSAIAATFSQTASPAQVVSVPIDVMVGPVAPS